MTAPEPPLPIRQKWPDQVFGVPCPIAGCSGILVIELALRAHADGLIEMCPIGISPISGDHEGDHSCVRIEALTP